MTFLKFIKTLLPTRFTRKQQETTLPTRFPPPQRAPQVSKIPRELSEAPAREVRIDQSTPEADETISFFCIITANGDYYIPYPRYEKITFHKAGRRIERKPITEEEYKNGTSTITQDAGLKAYLEAYTGIHHAALADSEEAGKLRDSKYFQYKRIDDLTKRRKADSEET